LTEGKTKIQSIEYAEEIQEFITMNDDVKISDELKQKIKCTPKAELLKIVKVIGSTPVKIESVEVYNSEYLVNNF